MSSLPAPHVVVLDGSPLYAEVYGSVFAADGYRVTALPDCAVDPADVLALLPDLIVLDLRCGDGLGGLDFLRRLRTDPAGRQVPVLVSTPASLVDPGRHEAELRALDVPLFDGFGFFDDLLAAARTATALARDVRRRSDDAGDRLRAGCKTDPPA
jgi:CheY-like chemotaxis protein